MQSTSTPPPVDEHEDRSISRIGLTLALLVGLFMVGFWIWAFLRGPGVPHQDELVSIELREQYVDYAAEPIRYRSSPSLDEASSEDRSAIEFMVQAELLCADMVSDLDELPNALTAETFDERADLVDQGTDLLLATIDHIGSVPLPSEENDRMITEAWLADLRIYEQDRRAFTAQLRSGDDGPFVLSASASTDRRVTTLLTSFAEVNSMYSCVPPGDVG